VLFALDQIDEIALQGVGTFEEMEVIDRARARVRVRVRVKVSSP